MTGKWRGGSDGMFLVGQYDPKEKVERYILYFVWPRHLEPFTTLAFLHAKKRTLLATHHIIHLKMNSLLFMVTEAK